ncbi:MAG TPA: hypothetical protein VNA21_13635 [Steroidobacteraceae bacterium]|nr:hypothetical protein [Steroidobacteraceae bacterium]
MKADRARTPQGNPLIMPAGDCERCISTDIKVGRTWTARWPYRDAARDEHRCFATQLEAQGRGGLPFQDLWTDHDRFDDDLT